MPHMSLFFNNNNEKKPITPYFYTCIPSFIDLYYLLCGPGSIVSIAIGYGAGRSGDRIPVGARFSAPVQTGHGAHPASYTMGTGSFPGVKSSRIMTPTPHLLLGPWSRKSRAIPLLPLWTVQPVHSLSVCTV